MVQRNVFSSPVLAISLGAWSLLSCAHAWAQLAPSGFTSVLNAPSADVVPTGSLDLGFANNNPEFARKWPGVGYSGSRLIGFGALPGLEFTGRLAYDGDTECNQYADNCRSWTRDLSFNGKYQFPVRLPLDTRLAVGVTDYGGAATNFKQNYGVVTSRWQYLEWSLGYARPTSATALLNGRFYSGTLHLTDRVRLSVEDDHRQRRYGASLVQPVARGVDVMATLSRKFAGDDALQTNQITLGLRWAFDHDAKLQGVSARGDGAPFEKPAKTLVQAREYEAQLDAGAGKLTAARSGLDMANSQPPRITPDGALQAAGAPPMSAPVAAMDVDPLLDAFFKNGFRHISVARTEDRALWVQAEPVGWRQSRADALGAALSNWLRVPGQPSDALWLTLTYLHQPVINLYTTRECAERFRDGADECAGRPSLLLRSAAELPRVSEWIVQGANSDWLHPRVELGLGLRYSVGTEYGLTDYSLAADTGWEVPLAKGLLWQGNRTNPLSNSDDYGKPEGYWYNNRFLSQVQANVVSYQAPLYKGSWIQLSQGYINPTDWGRQFNLNWLSPMGRWRLEGIAGNYETRLPGQEMQLHRPRVVSARYSIVPGFWSVDVTRGDFYNGDRGNRYMSHHWFGDQRLTLYYKDSQSIDHVTMPRTRFAGVEITFPLGPREAGFIGPLSIRGRDQFALALETKVKETDNYITPGYAVVPKLRHGLNDVRDQDRAGVSDLWANRYRIRAVMRP